MPLPISVLKKWPNCAASLFQKKFKRAMHLDHGTTVKFQKIAIAPEKAAGQMIAGFEKEITKSGSVT